MENCGFMEESWTLSSNPVSSLDQHAKKVVSDSQGPVDFVIGLVDSDSVFLGIQFYRITQDKCFLTSS